MRQTGSGVKSAKCYEFIHTHDLDGIWNEIRLAFDTLALRGARSFIHCSKTSFEKSIVLDRMWKANNCFTRITAVDNRRAAIGTQQLALQRDNVIPSLLADWTLEIVHAALHGLCEINQARLVNLVSAREQCHCFTSVAMVAHWAQFTVLPLDWHGCYGHSEEVAGIES